jgi:hypothetical protein
MSNLLFFDSDTPSACGGVVHSTQNINYSPTRSVAFAVQSQSASTLLLSQAKSSESLKSAGKGDDYGLPDSTAGKPFLPKKGAFSKKNSSQASQRVEKVEPTLNSGKLLSSLKSFLSGFQASFTRSIPVEVVQVKSNQLTEPSTEQAQASFSEFRRCSLATFEEPAAKQLPFQIKLKGHVIGEVSSQSQAALFAKRLEKFLSAPKLNPLQLQPDVIDGLPAVRMVDRILILDKKLIQTEDCNVELLATQLVNNLRRALSEPPLTLANAQAKIHHLKETGELIEGTASWYGPYFHGRLTATGEVFDQNGFTAAHPSLPFGTYLRVTNLLNGKAVIVRVNDRGPYIGDRTLDLSHEAAQYLDSEVEGVVPIEAAIMESTEPAPQQIARL